MMIVESTLTEQDRAVFRNLTENGWTAAVIARDWDKILEMCAADIVYMPADHPALQGHAELRAWFANFPTVVRFVQPLESADGCGDLAISRATFAATLDNAGERTDVAGKVLCTWRRNTAGQWLLKNVCWSFD